MSGPQRCGYDLERPSWCNNLLENVTSGQRATYCAPEYNHMPPLLTDHQLFPKVAIMVFQSAQKTNFVEDVDTELQIRRVKA